MPQSARLSAGRGVQWLFGQCPNELLYFYGGASLNTAVVIRPKGPKCLRNEQGPSFLGQDTLWILETVIWGHFLLFLSLFLLPGVA